MCMGGDTLDDQKNLIKDIISMLVPCREYFTSVVVTASVYNTVVSKSLHKYFLYFYLYFC